MTRRPTRLILLAAWLCATMLAQAGERQSAAEISRIEASIKELMARRHLPGLSIAVVRDNQMYFTRAYGTADLENPIPVSPATMFRIASVSKALTAVGAMQLVETGALDLDSPVQRYAPAFPVKSSIITTRQLLAHLSGIRHYRAGEGEYTSRFSSLTEALDIFKDDALLHEPGTRYTYTTFGYTLLGVVMEGASRLPFADYMKQRIFEPAGMRQIRVDDLFAIVPHRARGYNPRVFAEFNGDYRNPSLMDSSYKIPGGGFLSTAEDLARFAIAVNRGQLLRRETLTQMSLEQKTLSGTATGYGLGWYVGNRGSRSQYASIWHGGVQQGFTAELWLIPSRGFAVAILTNLQGGQILGLEGLAHEVADIVLVESR